jgi:hypothetical protein
LIHNTVDGPRWCKGWFEPGGSVRAKQAIGLGLKKLRAVVPPNPKALEMAVVLLPEFWSLFE